MKDYEPTYEGQYDKCCDERAALEIELSARDARIAELEIKREADGLLMDREREATDKIIATLERHLAACKEECRICREMDAIEAGTELVDETNWWDLCKQLPVARAATDAAGGVS